MTASRPSSGCVALVLLVLAAVAACARPAAAPPSAGSVDDRHVPADVLHLPLVDYQGRPTSLAAFHGRIIVLSDMLTLCQETCPLDTANLVATARAVPPDEHVAFVSVTVDPERDTVPRLAAYRALFAPPPANWTTLTGSPATLDRLWQWFGVYHRKVAEQAPAPRDWLTGQPLTYDVTHSDLVFFVGPDGTDRFVLDGAAHVARGDQLPATLSGFLNDEGRRNLAHPEAGTWTVDQALAALAWLSS